MHHANILIENQIQIHELDVTLWKLSMYLDSEVFSLGMQHRLPCRESGGLGLRAVTVIMIYVLVST